MTTYVETRQTRMFRWKLYFVILTLLALGVLAKVPAFIQVENLVDQPNAWSQVTVLMFIEQFFIFGLVPAGLGIFLIPRLGLRIPFLENWLLGESYKIDLWKLLRESIIFAVCLAVIGVVVQLLIEQDLNALGIDVGQNLQPNARTTWWSMLLLSFSAGFVEEIVFRLGLLTILAWGVNWLWKPRGGQLKPSTFWVVNILAALFFSLAHFVNYSALEVPLTFGLIWKTVVGNSLAALVFGWLYWKRGLESAILTHSLLDVCIYVVAPALLTLS
jgi:membrane protease YdiL (CAAX protease family)